MTKKTFFTEKLAKNPKTNKLWSILGPIDNQNIELCNPFHMEPKKNLMWVRAPQKWPNKVKKQGVGNADIFEIKYRDSGGRGVVKS